MPSKPCSARALRPTALHAAVLAALLVPLPRPAGAVSATWVGNHPVAPSSWANPLNWSPGFLPPSADDTALLFPNSFVASNNDIASGFRLNQIRAFDNGGAGGIGTIGGLSITLGGSSAQIFVGAAGTLALNAPLSGSVAFSKTGAGDLTLGGNNLALTGDLTVAAGRLNALSSGNLGSGAVTVNAGATLRSGGAQFIGGIAGAGSWQNDGATTLTVASGERSFSGSVTGSATLTKSGAGRQVFRGSVTSGGPVTVGGGELALAGSGASWVGATALSVANAATASVSGGARFTTAGAVTVGGGSAFASGTLAVDGVGSVFTSNGATLGSLAGARGTLALDRSGSFAAGLTLTVGAQGTGAVTVAGGGLLSATTAVIGQGIGSSGSVALSGAGSTWNTTNAVTVGNFGQGTLTLDGAQGSANAGMVLGAELSSSGTMSLANSATWAVNSGTFVVGMRGNGLASVSSGSVLTTQDASIGLVSGQGELHVDTGGQWINGGTMVVGSSAPGRLVLETGGRLTSGDTTLGMSPLAGGGSGNAATVLADAAGWTVNGELRVADAGTAQVQLRQGAQLQSTSATLANRAGSTASVTLTGTAGSAARTSWTNSQALIVGGAGSAQLTVYGSSTLDTASVLIGMQPGGASLVTLDGAGAELPQWTVRGKLGVGNGGQGDVLIRRGTLDSGEARIGASAGSTGSVSVVGAQSTWNANGDITVGSSDTGRIGGLILVTAGGRLRSTGTLNIQPNGAVMLEPQSLLSVAALVPSEGAQLNWTGGTLEISGPDGVTLGAYPYLGRVLSLTGDQALAVTNKLDVGSGTIVLSDTAQVRAGTLSLAGGQIVGNSVLKLGDSSIVGWGQVGTLVNGGTTNSAVEAKGGTLVIGDANATVGVALQGKTTVDSGATLVLMSRTTMPLHGLTTLKAGSRLQTLNGANMTVTSRLDAEGDAIVLGRMNSFGLINGPTAAGTMLTFNDDVDGAARFTGNVRFLQHFTAGPASQLGNLSLGDTATLVLDRISAQWRPATVSGLAELGGALTLKFAGGFTPDAGGSLLTLMDWGQHTGSFARFSVDGLGGAWTSELRYDADALRLSISAVPEPASWLAMLGGAALLLAWRRLQGRRAD